MTYEEWKKNRSTPEPYAMYSASTVKQLLDTQHSLLEVSLRAEQALQVLGAFDPFDDGNLWFARVDAEDVDKAVYELRRAIAKAKGE